MRQAIKKNREMLGDTPLLNPRQDELGYGQFAQFLSHSITNMAPEDGFVMGIYGAWGAGKTTLLNFIRHYLKKELRGKRPIVIDFNPWWFSDDESLIRHFFNQLQASLGKEPRFQFLRENVSKFAEGLSELPAFPWYSSDSWVRKVFGIVAMLASGDRKKIDVVQLKARIAKDLLKEKQKIVVIIDDIDRLTGEEVRQLFRIVKAVGNFPYIVYVLAFDKEIVEKALENAQEGIRGSQYLEKIVQVPIPLPMPEPGSVERMLTDKLDVLLANSPEQYWDPGRWAKVFNDAIRKLVTTPREVIRLINLLELTYPAMEGNVNPVDFIAINLLSITHPVIYDLIRESKEMFSGSISSSEYYPRTADRMKPFHERWLGSISEDERESVELLVKNIFPKIEAILGNTHYDDEDWEKQLRICHPSIFDLYFRLSLPKTAFVNTEMQAILGLAINQDEFEKKLKILLEEKLPNNLSRLSVFLERCEAYTGDDIPEKSIASIVRAFMNIGDELSPEEDAPRGMFGFDNEFRMIRLIHQLLQRLGEDERFGVLKDAVINGRALSLIAHEIGIKAQELEKDESNRSGSSINKDQLVELQGIALQKIREAAVNGSLISSRNLPQVLYRWREWANKDEPRNWCANFVKTDKHLITFLQKITNKNKRGDMGSGLVSEYLRIGPKNVDPWINSDSIISRIEKIVEDMQYSDAEREVAAQFINEYNMIKAGLDPDNPLVDMDIS